MPLPAAYLYQPVNLPEKVANIPKATDPGTTPTPTRSSLFKYTLTAPVVGSITAYMSTGVAGPNTATATYSKGGANFDGALGTTGRPDFPRNVVVTVTHGSSVVAVSGTITGIDLYGKTITEAWSVTATGTTKTFTGKKGFYRVDSLSITAAGDASADTVKLGTGNVFGLPLINNVIVPIGELQDGVTPTAGVMVAGSTTSTADRRGTYAPNATPDGAKVYTFYYICDDPTLSTT